MLLNLVVSLVAVGADVSYHDLAARIGSGSVSLAEAQSADHRQLVIGYLQVGLFLASGIVFVFWFSRAYKNLSHLGGGERSWGSGWAIGAWFVPFLNLVRPKAIANDIWRASDPNLREEVGLPSGRLPWYHHLWWVTFLLGAILSRVAFQRTQDAITPSALTSATLLNIAADSVYAVAAALTIVVVYQTAKRQRMRAGVLADRAALADIFEDARAAPGEPLPVVPVENAIIGDAEEAPRATGRR